jgi:hypothetical protein
MKLRQQTRVLKHKALTSFITAAEAFNSPRDDGRVTKVLLHLQHSFEMLLKVTLVKLIYIDPPYNTGRDFIYDDDYAESSGEYLFNALFALRYSATHKTGVDVDEVVHIGDVPRRHVRYVAFLPDERCHEVLPAEHLVKNELQRGRLSVVYRDTNDTPGC